MIFLIDFHKSWIERPARTAPASPEVYQGVFVLADVVGELHFLTFGSVHGEVDVLLANGGLLNQLNLLDDMSDVSLFAVLCGYFVDKGYLLFELKVVDELRKKVDTYRIGKVLFEGLKELRTAEEVAKIRDIPVDQVLWA